MAALTAAVVPLLLLGASCYSLRKRADSYGLMVRGAADGLRMLAHIAPALIVLLTAVQMRQAAGAVQLLERFLGPVLAWTGIPPQTLGLVLIRPISGSAALAVGAELIAQYGPDSPIGLTAAVRLGSTETTLYTICGYFGAAGVHKTRYAIPAALLAELTGVLLASWSVRWFF